MSEAELERIAKDLAAQTPLGGQALHPESEWLDGDWLQARAAAEVGRGRYRVDSVLIAAGLLPRLAKPTSP